MTREELLTQLKLIAYPCKGRLSPAARIHINKLLDNPQTRDTVAPEIDRANRMRLDTEPMVLKLVQPDDPRLPLIAQLSNNQEEIYNPRPACGSNFLQGLILAGPFDGLCRQYQCPNCGVTGIYYTPVL